MVQRFGSQERQWYTGQCPLIDGDRVILAPCGPDSLLVALDYRTGDEIWRTPNPRGWQMTHSSVMPVEFAGQRMYVYCGTGGTVGVSAEDGRLLWDETSWRENFATSPSPLALPEGRIFLSSGYDAVGAMWLQLKQQGTAIVAEAAGQLDRREFNSEQQTPVFYQGHVYGIRKYRGGQFVCLDLQGKELWNSGQDKFGHGPYLIADNMLLIFGEGGVLVAAEATAEAYRPLWRMAVYDPGHEAWGPMAIASGLLIVRDMTRMTCLDLRRVGQ
jgi:outer membrane protein assembly factor BamB